MKTTEELQTELMKCRCDVVQAAQVRKSSFVSEGPSLGRHGYHPTTHHASTVHAGTYVQQVGNRTKSPDSN